MGRHKAKFLNEQWKVGARQARYHWEGLFYEHLTQFPGALFDLHGYILFNTQEDYDRCAHFRGGTHQEKLNVYRPGISDIPGYVKKV